MLGFYGAKLKSKLIKEKVCVWDIGGSSMQIICERPNSSEKLVYLGHLASVPFKNKLLELKMTTKSSPNPIGQKVLKESKLITQLESKKVHSKLGNLLEKNIVLGIGGVHYYAVSKAISSKDYTVSKLNTWLDKHIDLSDDQLGGGKFVDTSISNVVLVQGMMNGLNIKSVRALKVNLTEGVLANQELW